MVLVAGNGDRLPMQKTPLLLATQLKYVIRGVRQQIMGVG
jgi:hypothetical protein